MFYTCYCPDCHAAYSSDHPLATMACADCHAKRRARIAEIEARYPSAEQLGLLGSSGNFPIWIAEQMRGKKRRIHRKPGIRGG